jgi:hypothetical protein
MTVQELIDRLKQFPRDTPIGVGTLEDGELFIYAMVTRSEENV